MSGKVALATPDRRLCRNVIFKMRFFIGAKSGEVMTDRLTEEGSRNEYRSNR